MTPAGIELEHLGFAIGDFEMPDLSLRVEAGEYFVLTGPNGSGKTLMIKLIIGLYRPAAGRIALAGRDVTDLPPWKRDIGYVPQDGLLLPNRTVEGNIRFGLEVRGRPRGQIDAEVRRVAQMLKIDHLLDRRVEALSGGERQKAALARAVAFQPRVLLLDEPVSAIDEASRDDLCGELRRIQRTLGLTVLHVSHNQQEIDQVADRVGYLRNGRLAEVAVVENSPEE